MGSLFACLSLNIGLFPQRTLPNQIFSTQKVSRREKILPKVLRMIPCTYVQYIPAGPVIIPCPSITYTNPSHLPKIPQNKPPPPVLSPSPPACFLTQPSRSALFTNSVFATILFSNCACPFLKANNVGIEVMKYSPANPELITSGASISTQANPTPPSASPICESCRRDVSRTRTAGHVGQREDVQRVRSGR